MSKTVVTTPWYNNKAIISLNDQANIQGPLVWSNQHVLIRIQGVKLSNYVLKGLDFMFKIRNVQDPEYTGQFCM